MEFTLFADPQLIGCPLWIWWIQWVTQGSWGRPTVASSDSHTCWMVQKTMAIFWKLFQFFNWDLKKKKHPFSSDLISGFLNSSTVQYHLYTSIIFWALFLSNTLVVLVFWVLVFGTLLMHLNPCPNQAAARAALHSSTPIVGDIASCLFNEKLEDPKSSRKKRGEVTKWKYISVIPTSKG